MLTRHNFSLKAQLLWHVVINMDATLRTKTTKHTVDSLSDFRTDNRVLILSAMAAVIGALSAGVAYVLLWLIWLITNISFHHRFSAEHTGVLGTPMGNHLGWGVIFIPVIGALFVG